MTLAVSFLAFVAVIGAFALGWFACARRERQLDREALERISEDQRAVARMPQRAPIFHATTGGIGPRNVWAEQHGKNLHAGEPVEIPHEEQAPMFLDQFLLRYFYDLVQPIDENAPGRPWELFVQKNPWAKEMPVLFHQLTSIKLTDMQLNGAIADYMSRLSKLEGSQRS